ncbi:MAG: CRISPR-associated helicase Cas3' [Magnetococcales bacterium]|nr:CRISPR-associated helicase Cas3' [Magnetococcales bacterium]
MPAPPFFWSKRCQDGSAYRYHPLTHHALEVAVVLRALLQSAVVRKRLARAAGLDDLTPMQVDRLAVLAGLHDAGKCNHGFQEQGPSIRHGDPLQPDDNTANRKWETHGHVREIFFLLLQHDRASEAAKNLCLETIGGWFVDNRQFCEALWAVFCHHGAPLPGDPHHLGEPIRDDKLVKTIWEERGGRDPINGLHELVEALRQAFPQAFAAIKEPIPFTPRMAHLFTGLVTLADWIASDADRFFPFAVDPTVPPISDVDTKAYRALKELGMTVTAARQRLPTGDPHHAKLIDQAAPNAIQRALATLPLDQADNAVVILEAETGAGKTEAALIHFMRLFAAGAVDGLYFALPTRAAAVQIHTRVRDAVKRAFGEQAPPVVLAVPGYIRVDDVEGKRLVDEEEGKRLAPFRTLWPDESDRSRFRGWAAEHPKRYLAAPIAVGTIDQVLLSTLAVKHAQMRAAALSRLLLVVDEVHASDAYMTVLLHEVLKRHAEVGGRALLMSATLGAGARSQYLQLNNRAKPPDPAAAAVLPYPLISCSGQAASLFPVPAEGRGKEVHVTLHPWADETTQVARLALEAARSGARVLVIRNTVRWVMQTQQALESEAGTEGRLLLRCAGVAAPHHARFAPADRRLLDLAIEEAFGKKSDHSHGLVAVSSQTTEQSLDIDADFLITDLCPMDVFLQRVGRLHRHARSGRPAPHVLPKVVMLTPAEDLEACLDAKGQATSAAKGHGWGSVYEDLRILAATLAELQQAQVITIPADNRRLVEAATHPERLKDLVTARGKAWQTHGEGVWGTDAAKRNTARHGIYDRDKSLWECNFKQDISVQLATRLGARDRLIHLDPVPVGPFGGQVQTLTLPGHWFQDDTTPESVPPSTPEPGVIQFSFADKRFHYDRLGLRLMTDDS